MFQKTSCGDTFKPIREMHMSGPPPHQTVCQERLEHMRPWDPGRVDGVARCGRGKQLQPGGLDMIGVARYGQSSPAGDVTSWVMTSPKSCVGVAGIPKSGWAVGRGHLTGPGACLNAQGSADVS